MCVCLLLKVVVVVVVQWKYRCGRCCCVGCVSCVWLVHGSKFLWRVFWFGGWSDFFCEVGVFEFCVGVFGGDEEELLWGKQHLFLSLSNQGAV